MEKSLQDAERQFAFQMFEKGIAVDQVKDSFIRRGLNAEAVDDLLVKFTLAKKQKRGTILIVIGLLFLGFGFVLTLLMQTAGVSKEIALYGPTIIGAVCLMIGFIDVFG